MAKILIAGDFAPRTRVETLIENDNFSEVLSEIIPYTSQVDYSILNLECPVVTSEQAASILKNGPSLKCTSKAINAIKYAGFDMLTLANNHFYDYGEIGVQTTLQECRAQGIEYVGGGHNIAEASQILYKQIDNKIIAFINCCESEFSIATENSGGSAPLDPIQQFYYIREAKLKSDHVVLIVHGGPEKYQYPTPRMKKLYRFYIDAGADIVINHHQHCFSGYEVYKSHPIFYGLGNFSFDYNRGIDSTWNEGYMVIVDFEDDIKFNIIPYVQGYKEPGVKIMDEKQYIAFTQSLDNINRIILDDVLLEKCYQEFCSSTANQYLIMLEPYTNKYFRAARIKHLIPSFLSRKRALSIMNYILCESHLDRFKRSLINYIKEK